MPVLSPATQTTDDSNLLYWQQQAARRAQAQQNQQDNAVNSPIVNQIIDPQANYAAAQQTVQRMGQSANQGVQGSLATQKVRNDAAQQATFAKQQQDALIALQKQQIAMQKQMQTQYANAANQYSTNAAKQYSGSGPAGQAGLPGSAYTGQAQQIAQYARQAGFPESAIPTVVAIAQAESSGRANATNTANANGTQDYGLMQINSSHADLLKTGNWADPQANMNMAYQIYKGAGGTFRDWSTYNNGAYNKFLGIGEKAASAIQPAYIQPYQVQTTNGLRNAVVADAKQYLGLPYVWGGTDLTKGVDCSGLVQSVYKQMGFSLPRTADQQSHIGVRTSISNLEAGDLVAWQGGWRGPNYVGHIAIYLGNGKILESPHTGANVRIRALRTDEKPFGVHLTVLGK